MIKQEFGVVMLNAEGKKKALAIAESFTSLLSNLELICPDGRELQICRRKLEEACMFAKKAMCSLPDNHQGEPQL